MAHPTVIAKELNILNRYCKRLRILEDYLTQYEEGNFSPRILMAGKTSNEKIDQLGRTMDIDVKAYIRELFENEWIKEYGSEQNLLENAPDVLKIKGDLSELIVAIQHKRKMYYDWKDKVLFIAEKKGNLRLMPMHPPAQKIHGVWMDCVVYGKRRFHRYSSPEKAADYELKYPDAADYGLNGYLNYTIYSSDEIKAAETVILDYLESNKKYLKSYNPILH